MDKNQGFVMNVKGTRNRIFGKGVQKQIYAIFRGSLTFCTFSSKIQQLLYGYFCTKVIASKVCQGIFAIEYNISAFTVAASISVKAIITRFCSYSVVTQN